MNQEALIRTQPAAGGELATLSRQAVVDRVRKVQEIFTDIMKRGVHYGVVPGTGKPSLWQPGAEALGLAFQLRPQYELEELPGFDGDIRYRVICRLEHYPTGLIVGEGVGEASSLEEKYRWRKAVCDEEWVATDPSRRREKWAKTRKPPFKVYTVKQVRTDPADVGNTILKMAKKRAHIDAMKSTVAASDIFDQDLEDLSGAGIDLAGEAPKVATPKSTAPKTQAKGEKTQPKSNGKQQVSEEEAAAAAPPPGEQVELPVGDDGDGEPSGAAGTNIPEEAWEEVRNLLHDKGTISTKQRARLFAIAGEHGWASQQVVDVLLANLELGVNDIPFGDPYDKVVAIFAAFSPAE